jgi:serine/threonine-protein kinase
MLHIQNESVRQRMLQEGRVQSGLRHPNIVAVTDIVDAHGSMGLVMELIDGPTLERWLASNQPTLEEAEFIFLSVLSGMERAHQEGLIHRDLKPGNVMMAPVDGRYMPKVTDFGLAKALHGAPAEYKATMTGVMMGTPAYMAPEQIRDASGVDHRADIFSLGCMLYELVCGTVPFDQDDWVEVLGAIKKGLFISSRIRKPELPERIQLAIEGALQVQVSERIQSVAELRAIATGGLSESRSGPVVLPLKPLSSTPRFLTQPEPVSGRLPTPRLEPPPPAVPKLPPPPPPEPKPASLSALAWVGIGTAIGLLLLGIAVGGIWFFNQPAPVAAISTPLPVETTPPPAATPVAQPIEPEDRPPLPEKVREKARITPVLATPTPALAVHQPEGAIRVKATGAPPEVTITGGGKTWTSGAVPVGSYVISASYGGEPQRFPVVVEEGQTLYLKCDGAFRQCKVQ